MSLTPPTPSQATTTPDNKPPLQQGHLINMSDLCYNCSKCHLQTGPCQQDLVQCEICYSWGHQYIFCPRGVANRDPDYRYWALCHNCDLWHLPQPCTKPYHTCGQCGNTGHMDFFCPVHPTDRAAYIQYHRMLAANGQHNINYGMRPPYQGDIPQQTITHIKLDAARQAFGLLDQGYSPAQAYTFMAGPPRAMNPPLMLGGANNRQVTHSWQQAPQQSQRQQTQPNVPTQPTALPMTPNHKFEFAQGLASTYVSMHQRFDQGDLARTIEQERPMDTVPMMGDPFSVQDMQGMHTSQTVAPAVQTTPMMQNTILKTQNTPPETRDAKLEPQDSSPEQQATPTIETTEDTTKSGKTKKPKKIAKTEREGTPGGSALKQGPRCAKCIKSHKRCPHRVQQSLTPQPAFDVSFVTPSPANYFPVTGTPEGHSPALPTLPGSPFAVQAEHADIAPMPTAVAPTNTATAKRKR